MNCFANGEVAGFAILLAALVFDAFFVQENGRSILEIKAAFGFRPLALCFVPFERHLTIIIRT